MEIQINRGLPITIIEQVKGQITYDVMCGKLEPGSHLPSVRDLSAQLEVAPMTIARVYRELASDSLIETKPGVGTFVADVTDLNVRLAQSAEKNLRHLTEAFLQQTMALGYTPEDVCAALMHQIQGRETADPGPRVALVGNFQAASGAYAREVEAILENIDARVQTILMSELQADLEASLQTLRGVKLVITIPSRLQEVRDLLGPSGYDVVAVAFQVSADTRRRVSAIRPEMRVGVIATYPEFLQSLREGVLAYGMSDQQPLCAYVDQEDRVKEIVGQVDVVVYASGSGKIVEWLPEGVEAFEYRHVPDPDSLNRLRPFLR